MSDDITPPVPFSKAAEFAVACLKDDEHAYYRRFEFDRTRFPELPEGEIVRVEFRRIRPSNVTLMLPIEAEEAMVAAV